jgi:hypothetical protein
MPRPRSMQRRGRVPPPSAWRASHHTAAHAPAHPPLQHHAHSQLTCSDSEGTNNLIGRTVQQIFSISYTSYTSPRQIKFHKDMLHFMDIPFCNMLVLQTGVDKEEKYYLTWGLAHSSETQLPTHQWQLTVHLAEWIQMNRITLSSSLMSIVSLITHLKTCQNMLVWKI